MISPDWEGLKAPREFRGVTYNMRVKRAGQGDRVTLTVDGAAIEGRTVTAPVGALARIGILVWVGYTYFEV